jgi:hypothetical protein
VPLNISGTYVINLILKTRTGSNITGSDLGSLSIFLGKSFHRITPAFSHFTTIFSTAGKKLAVVVGVP